MTRQEYYDALIEAGIDFDHRAKKAVLVEIYDRLHVHREPTTPQNPVVPTEPAANPNETEEERLIREAEEDDGEPELDENGEPIDPELGGEGTDTTTPPNELDDLMGKISGAKAPDPSFKKQEKPLFSSTARKKKKGESSPDSFRIEGYVLLLITDTIFPFAFAFINNWIDKKVKVQASDLQLSEKDFDKLEPLADQAADYMSVGLNPLVGFVLVSTFMYSNNLLLVRAEKEIRI